MTPTQYSDDFRRCLESLDIAGVRRLWRHVNPNLPQPKNDQDALITMHMARTQARSIRFRARAYSHSWLIDRGYPSALPDELKPQAQRLYPVVVDAVGISVKASSKLMLPVAKEVHKAMEYAVLDAYADNRKEPVFVKQRMQEARAKTLKALGAQLREGTQ